MSSHKSGYVIGVVLLAIAVSIPQILVGLFFVFRIVTPVPPLRPNQIVGSAAYQGWTVLKNAAFWRDKFVYLHNGMNFQTGTNDWQITGIDLETGKATRIMSIPNRSGAPLSLMVFGDRMWLVGNTESYEVVDGVAMNSTISPMVAFGVNLGLCGANNASFRACSAIAVSSPSAPSNQSQLNRTICAEATSRTAPLTESNTV